MTPNTAISATIRSGLTARRPAAIRRPFYGLARKKLLIFAVFALVVTTGMITTLLITPKYEATMSILISRDRIDPQINPSDKNPEIMLSAISDEEFNSELELVKSAEVITGAVTGLGLVTDRRPKADTWLADLRQRIKTSIYDLGRRIASDGGEQPADSTADDFSVEKAVNHVLANLEVVPTKKSRVIKITYSDTDPLRAKRTLEAIYQEFVDLHVRINERPEAEQVFKAQTDRFSDRLNATTNELKQFDSANGVTGAEIGTQRSLLLKQLYETQAQENSTATEIADLEQRVRTLRSNIDAMPEQIQTGSVSKYVGALDAMKSELVKLEQQRTDLLQKYKPDSRFVRENEERIQKLRQNIAAERANPPEERSFALNELRRKLEGELYAAQTSLDGARKRQKTLTEQASRLSSEVVALNSKSIERDAIERRRSVNEEAYLLYQKKARENEIGEVLNKERVLNFSVVDPPRTDGQPKSPKPLLNLLVLAGVGLVAGVAAALFIDRSVGGHGRRVRSAGDLEDRYGLPVLVSIPVMSDGPALKDLRLGPLRETGE
jgi:polysaccharide biosynthesis transport protein